MEKEGQKQFGRSFILESHLNQRTGEWTAVLDNRYGQKRDGLPKDVALKMIRLDDTIVAFGIKKGDRIDIKVKVREVNPETGQEREKEVWQEPIDGQRFKAVHEGKLVFSVPKGSNAPLEYHVDDIIHVRKHRRARKAEDAPKKFHRRRDLSKRAEQLGIETGDSFQVYTKVKYKDVFTGKKVESTGWRQTYGIEFRAIVGDQVVIDDNTGKASITRRLREDIKDIRKAEPLPYPFSDRKYLSQK